MSETGKTYRNIKNEDGTTLIEILVATAILVSVLLPASMWMGYIANNPQNEEKILALGIAQTEMEKVLNEKSYADYEKEFEDKWLIKSVVTSDVNLVQVEIFVYRQNKKEPIVSLTTERLFYETDTKK